MSVEPSRLLADGIDADEGSTAMLVRNDYATERCQHQIASKAASLNAAIDGEARDEPSGDGQRCSVGAEPSGQFGPDNDAQSQAEERPHLQRPCQSSDENPCETLPIVGEPSLPQP